MTRTWPLLFALAGCSAGPTSYPGDVIVYGEATPPPVPEPRAETESAAPTPDHFWVPGHWEWNGVACDWVAGQWEILPRPGAALVAPYWDVRGRHRIWVPGHWE